MFRDSFDKRRPCCVILKDTAQAANTLRECFVSYRDATPHIIHEAVFRHERASIADQQDERIEIAAGYIHHRAVAVQTSAINLKREAPELKAI